MPEAKKTQGEIQNNINKLFEISETLEKVQCSLIEDLGSVLRNHTVEKGEGGMVGQKEEPPTTELGSQLNDIYCQLYSILRYVEECRSRIEL